MPQEDATKIFLDNKSALALAKNPVFHDRNKHIDTRYHFIKEYYQEGGTTQVCEDSLSSCRYFYKALKELDF